MTTDKRLVMLEVRMDRLDAIEIGKLRSAGWTWKDIHEWRFPHLSYYKVRLLGGGDDD